MDANNIDLTQLMAALDEFTRALGEHTKTLGENAESAKDSVKSSKDAIAKEKGYRKEADGSYTKLKDALKERIDIEEEVNKELEKQFGKETVLKDKQEALFKKELASLGYIIDANNKLAKSMGSATVELTNFQKQQLTLAKKQLNNEKLLENQGKSLQELTGKYKSFSDLASAGSDHLLQLSSNSKFLTSSILILGEVSRAAATGLSALYTAAESMAKSIYNGERGQKVAAKAIEGFTKEVSGAVERLSELSIGLGTAAIMIGFVTGGMSLIARATAGAAVGIGLIGKIAAKSAEKLAELNTIAAEQNDIFFENFSKLGQASMAGAKGMTAIKEMAEKLKIAPNQIGRFTDSLIASANEVRLLGSSSADAVNKIVDIGDAINKSPMLKALQKMGIAAEEQYEHSIKYAALQTRLGLMQSKSTAEVVKGLQKYIEELDTLATITGISRKEQEEARNYLMAQQTTRAALLEARDKGDQKRIQAIETALKIAEVQYKEGRVRQATGLMQNVASGGIVGGSEESVESYMTQGAMIRKILAGERDANKLYLEGLQESMRQFKTMAPVAKIPGVSTPGFMPLGEMGATMDAMDKAEKLIKAVAESEKRGEKFDFEKWAKQERLSTDKNTEKQIDLINKQRDMTVDFIGAVSKFSETVDLNAWAIDKFKEQIDKFKDYVERLTGKKETAPSPTTQSAARERAASNQKVLDLEKQLETARKDKNLDEIKRLRIELATAREEARKKALEEVTAAHNANMNKQVGVSRPNIVSGGRSAGAGGATAGDLKRYGLRIKEGDVQRPGADIDDRLIDIASKVQDALGSDLGHFSSFNDRYHMDTSSQHAKGLAFDFVLANKKKPSKEEGAKIVNLLKSLGADNAIDEYNNPSSRATAGHFHAELKGRFGGIFDGPDKGYSVELHGKEAIIPMPDLQRLMNKDSQEAVSKQPLSTIDNMLRTAPEPTPSQNERILVDLYSLMDNKLSSIIDRLDSSVGAQEEILKYSRV